MISASTIIAISSAIFSAIANIMARYLVKDKRAQNFVPVNFLTMAVTLIVFSPFFYSFKFTLFSLSTIILISFIDTFGNYFYFKTFEKSEASAATPLLAISPFFTFILGWIFINDTISLKSFITMLIIVLMVIYFSFENKSEKISTKKIAFNKEMLNPLFSSVIFGATAIPIKFLLTTGYFNAPTLFMFRSSFIALFSLLFFKFSIKEISISQFRIIFIRGLSVITQYILLYLAFTRLNIGVASTLGNITPIFVFIFSIFFLKEKPNLKKLFLCILILLLSFSL